MATMRLKDKVILNEGSIKINIDSSDYILNEINIRRVTFKGSLDLTTKICWCFILIKGEVI